MSTSSNFKVHDPSWPWKWGRDPWKLIRSLPYSSDLYVSRCYPRAHTACPISTETYICYRGSASSWYNIQFISFSNENTIKQYLTMTKWCIVIFWSEIWHKSIKHPCNKFSISRSSYNMVSVIVQTYLLKSMIFKGKVTCVPIIYYIISLLCQLLLTISAGQTSCQWLFWWKNNGLVSLVIVDYTLRHLFSQ